MDHDLGPGLQGNPLAWLGEEIADLRRRLSDLERTPALANEGTVSTGATTGFLYLPTCAGTPMGTPLDFGGSPLVYDTAAHKLWAYSGGLWRARAFT